MKTKTQVAKEDPEAKARREVEEARADADKTSALQQILDRRTRKVLRIFGKAPGVASSGSSGVPGRLTIANMSGGGFMAGGGDSGGGGTIGGNTGVALTGRDILSRGSGEYGRDVSQFWY